MSEIRLVMVENGKATSGHVPSSSIPAILWAISVGAVDTNSLWNKIEPVDPSLSEHFTSNSDHSPLLEGFDDGLLVISWDHSCIESFQVYQPLRLSGKVTPHNGLFLESDHEGLEYQITGEWSVVDHHFEESRH